MLIRQNGKLERPVHQSNGKKEGVRHYISHQDWHASNTLKMPEGSKPPRAKRKAK